MDDDGTEAWGSNEEGLQNLIDDYEKIQARALRAAAEAVAPRLVEAAPARVSDEQSGGYKPPVGGVKTLKEAVRARVAKDRKTGKLQAIIDFGKWYTWVAHIVDVGHRAPYAKTATKLNLTVGRNTPAHPFVRAVQDSCVDVAQEAYTEAMTKGITQALKGGK